MCFGHDRKRELLGMLGGEIRASTVMSIMREPTSLSQSSCRICTRILVLVSSSAREGTTEALGYLEDLLQGDCVHVGLFGSLSERWAAWLRSGYTINASSPWVVTAWKSRPGLYFKAVLQSNEARNSPLSYWQLVLREDVPSHPGTSLFVGEQWINIDVLRRRIAYCDTHHAHTYREHLLSRKEDVVKPRFLVDTHRGCLVNGQEVCSGYVALSYQWGQANNLRNNTSLCESLFATDALRTEHNFSKIPRTIRDAFALVQLLGYRYLWVDSLCVVQDDLQQLHSELAQMHLIYNSATFTIIAVDGIDADYGLRGFEGITEPRSHKLLYARLSNSETLIGKESGYRENMNSVPSKYYLRAWTFQEHLMSNRSISFESGSVAWRCHFGKSGEGDPVPHEPSIMQTSSPLWDSEIPTLQGLNTLIARYNIRELSFPEDAFAAFAGVQHMLERRHGDRFLYGLPEFWFDIALNWTPLLVIERDAWAPSIRVTRRVPSSQHRSFQQPYQLPSWSWVGWTGETKFPYDSALELRGRHPVPCFTEPVATWYTMADPSSNNRRKVGSGWYDCRLSARDDSTIPPVGWKRIWQDEKDLKKLWDMPDYISGQRYYFAPNKSSHSQFWYPFPITEPVDNDQDAPSLQTAYLSAKTRRAYLSAQAIAPESRRGRCLKIQNYIWLTRPSGQHVGYLQLPIRADAETLDLSEPLRSIELVATCKGYTANISVVGEDWDETVDWFDERNTYLFNAYEACYFVLWIEWTDGVAYRRASGAVAAEVWEQDQEKEPVDLILG